MSTSPTRRPRGTLWLLRLSLAVHAVCLVAQPILAGRYLDGDYDAIGAHSLNGSLLPASGMVVGVAALAYWVAGGVGWPLLLFGGLWLAEGFQIGMGYARVLAIHIPLGVTLVVVGLGLAVWVWRPAAARPRRRGRMSERLSERLGRAARGRRSGKSTRAALDRVAAAVPAAGTAPAHLPGADR